MTTISSDERHLVELEHVGCTFGSGVTAVVALYNATGHVAANAHIAIVGPSGSGKSTLLHLMAGILRPTSGQLVWPALGNPSGRPGRAGIVFQGPSLLPPLDVVENVALPLLIQGADELSATEAALGALEMVDLLSLRQALPEELSGGQSQRVAVARVLASRPRLILADEPTGQLDRTNGDMIIDALLAAAEQIHAGLVVATHDPHVSDRLDEQWHVADGRLRTGARA